MFYLYHHYDLDRLAELLAALLERRQRRHPLEPDTIVVPNDGGKPVASDAPRGERRCGRQSRDALTRPLHVAAAAASAAQWIRSSSVQSGAASNVLRVSQADLLFETG
jgi:hypothetical protein